MKVIDLLNKIAKGEEVPNKIKYDVLEETKGYIYTYSKEDKDYTCLDEFNEKEYLFNQIFNSTITDLNDEVEIIEEEKDIERLEDFEKYPRIPKNEFETELMKYIAIHRVKINELIDIVKELKNEI